jgi:hypothetical protein
MEKLITNKSLNFIITQFNLGMIEFEDIDKLKIISDNKPNHLIKIIEFDLAEYLYQQLKNFSFKIKPTKAESNLYDFVVFSVNDDTLMCMSLLEMINILNLTNEKFDLNIEEWNLIVE